MTLATSKWWVTMLVARDEKKNFLRGPHSMNLIWPFRREIIEE